MKPTGPALAIAAAVCLSLPGCGSDGSRPDGSGTIECVQVEVASEVGGRIAELGVEEGAAVRRGDTIARIEATSHKLRRDEAAAALGYAQAQLNLLAAGARDEDIERAREQTREAEAVAGAAEADLERIEGLFDAGSASEKQLGDARAQAERAAAARAAAQQVVAKLEHGSREEELDVARALVRQAEARLALAEKSVSDCVVAAPAGGTVTTLSREVGELVGAGAPIATVSRLDAVWLSIYVPGARLTGVNLGQRAQVRVDGDARLHDGTITFISPEAEFTPRDVQTPEERAKLVYRVKISLSNPEGLFKPGMAADGYLEPAQ
jgi:HlyD family secretion protein